MAEYKEMTQRALNKLSQSMYAMGQSQTPFIAERLMTCVNNAIGDLDISLEFYEKMYTQAHLPDDIIPIAKDYVNRKISKEEAKSRLEKIKEGYEKGLRELGIEPKSKPGTVVWKT